MLRTTVHMALHVLAPAAVARFGFPRRWKRAWAVMVATMAVDLDHLLATPIFDPDRCSIGFHPLHTWPAMALYLAMALAPKTRLVGLGLVIHMALDAIDCIWAGSGLG
ncbi:hypothetical protein DSCA_33180 [Desulfosarcina alkanivorans]|jgi:hypothetical protein|uniref:Metal-dependent hydrolase n=1 Tax=Desulfosarcina alkanivorans TaxID=571177 RepID=A0A5K7YKP0_9BACT|nr:DUF6122 family protein [Desulfosarcina alkanivorans]BBO69388.1 hypothetical protein DSCA_33180 [Desulfosarcina alkanivorans]